MQKSESRRFDISVVLVLAYGRSVKRIKISVDSLNRQDKKRVQLCFIAHGSNPKSQELVKEWSKYPVSSRWVPNDNKSYNACFGRNAAIPLLEGKLVFFLHDAACLEGNDYLTRLWNHSGKGKFAVTTRNIVCMNKLKNPAILDQVGWFAHQDAIPAKYFKRLKFDEQFDGAHGYDDKDLERRAIKVGCKFVIVANLVSRKIHPTDKLYTKSLRPEHSLRNYYIYNWKTAVAQL